MKITATVLAVLLSAAPVSTLWADTYFSYGNYLEEGSVLDFGLITTDAPATLEVYDFIGGDRGELLGTTDLHFGANADVTVNVGVPPKQDVLAMIKAADGHVIAVQHFHVHD